MATSVAPSFLELSQNNKRPRYILPSLPNQGLFGVPRPLDFPFPPALPHLPQMDEDAKLMEEIAMSLKNFSESQTHPQVNVLGQHQNVPSLAACTRCRGMLSGEQKNVLFDGNLFHPHCFTCVACNEVLDKSYLQKDGKPYCEKDYARLFEDSKAEDVPKDLTIMLTTQPAKFQIANYNIHPAPSMTIDTPLNGNHTVYAHLVEYVSKTIVNGGFQSGDVRVLRSGQQTLYFTGLKLNKMGPIKTELHFQNSRQLNSEFCVQFKIGTRTFYSSPFKLVSSCSQLPQEIRENVRPTKKMPSKRPFSQTGSESPEQNSDASPESSPQLPFSSPPSQEHNSNSNDEGQNMDEEIRTLRQEMEVAIQQGNAEAASQFAFKLATAIKSRQ